MNDMPFTVTSKKYNNKLFLLKCDIFNLIRDFETECDEKINNIEIIRVDKQFVVEINNGEEKDETKMD